MHQLKKIIWKSKLFLGSGLNEPSPTRLRSALCASRSGVARAPQAPRPQGPARLTGPARGPPGRSTSRRNPLTRGPNNLFTLHYITSFHTPITPTVANEFPFSKVFWRYQCLWVPEDWTEENSMPSVRRTRNSARRTLVSTVEVHIGSCWRISVSHDQAGQRRMLSCPTGTQGCDQLASGAWARRACR